MSTLRSALEEFQAADPDRLDEAGLEEGYAELERGADIVLSERLRWLAAIERRGTYARDGHVSLTSWLAQRFRKTWSAAARLVHAARALEKMPATSDALDDGDITSSALEVLAPAWEVDPETFARAEAYLVQAAKTLPVPDLRRVVATWTQAAEDALGTDSSRRRFERRRLHVSPTFGGMVRVDGDLDPETGQTVITALRAVADAGVRTAGEDVRTPPQRRADALGEICRQWLDGADRPLVGGERPHVTLTVDLATLEGRPPFTGSASLGRSPGSGAELEDVGPIPAEAARRLACDASVSRVITKGPCEPLDVGRRTQVVPAGIRRAVVVRDRGCRFPGCDRPPGWSDAHHVRHWAHGGDTALSNLVLLCRRHHRLVHHGFGLEMADGVPRFSRPDGTVLEERGPP